MKKIEFLGADIAHDLNENQYLLNSFYHLPNGEVKVVTTCENKDMSEQHQNGQSKTLNSEELYNNKFQLHTEIEFEIPHFVYFHLNQH